MTKFKNAIMNYFKNFKDYIWPTSGFIALIIAIFTPFIIYRIAKNNHFGKSIDSTGEISIPKGLDLISILGSVGDFIGGSTVAFFTLANFMFFVYTVRLQKKQLKMANDQYLGTEKTMKQQQFETQFYNLLTYLKEKKDQVTFKNTISGEAFFGEEAIVHYFHEQNKLTQFNEMVRLQQKWINDYFNSINDTNLLIQEKTNAQNLIEGTNYSFETLLEIYQNSSPFDQMEMINKEVKAPNNILDYLRIINSNSYSSFAQKYNNYLSEQKAPQFIEQILQSFHDLQFNSVLQIYILIESHINQYIKSIKELYNHTQNIQTSKMINEERTFYENLVKIQLSHTDQLLINYYTQNRK